MRQFLVYLFVLSISSIDVFAGNGYSELMEKHPMLPKESAHGSIMAEIFRDNLLARIKTGFTTIVPVTHLTNPEEALVIFDKIDEDCHHVSSDLDQLELVGVNQFKPERVNVWKEMKGDMRNEPMIFGGLKSSMLNGSPYMVYYFYILPQINPLFETSFKNPVTGFPNLKYAEEDERTAAELTAQTFMLEIDNIKASDYTLYEKKGIYICVRVIADGIDTALISGIPATQKYIGDIMFSNVTVKVFLTLKLVVEMASSGGLHVRRLRENHYLVGFWFSMNSVGEEQWNMLKRAKNSP